MNEHVVIARKLDDWGTEVPLVLSREDRRRHMYIAGQTGTGKTTLLRNMILQDIEAGRGVGIIDPHGDLAEEILEFIPAERVNDVVYFDPSDYEHPIGFNPLFDVPIDKRHAVASGYVGTVKGIWPEFFGPRMEDTFNAALAAILECENISSLALSRMLSDEEYRRWVLKQVKDPWVRSYWERFDFKDLRTQAEIVAPIENKLNQFLLPIHLRNILSQVRSRFDLRFQMDNGRIFIANLSKGKIGENNSKLIGAFLVSQFELAAKSRADVPERSRQDFHLYVDEFQSFVSDSFASILSEARKYRLCLTVAHQYLDQLTPKIREAVFGNVGSLVAFRVGYEDAERLERAFGRTFSASAFTGLDNREICVRLLSNGRDTEPCLGRVYPPEGVRHGKGDSIIRRSRERYATPKEKIERRIARWLEYPDQF